MRTTNKSFASTCSRIIPILLAAAALSCATGCLWDWLLPPVTPTTTGACCASDGTCSVLTEAACTTAGGTYQGDGTSCTPNPCSAAGPDGSALYASDCASCHGSDGTGGSAPAVSGMSASQLTTGLDSTTHGSISLTTDEIAAMASFLGG